MTVTTHEPDPDDSADDELAAKRAGQSATAEEDAADGARAVLEDVGQATGVRTPELDEATEPVRPAMIR